MSRFYAWRYLREWIAFAPFFFRNAPFHRWGSYFDSSHRIASGFGWYRGEEAAAETISELAELDSAVLLRIADESAAIQFCQQNPGYRG